MSSLITKENLTDELLKLGVKRGDILNVKASVKSIGKIDGGVETLISALLDAVGDKGTIVTDSFVRVYGPMSSKFRSEVVDRETPSYAGALANAMISYPGSIRSTHPVQKFVLIGAHAKELADSHGPDSYAYEVLRLMAERGGKNLKIGPDEKVPGVGTTHVAIGIAGLRQRRRRLGVRYKEISSGQVRTFIRNWSGGCMKAFYNLNTLYQRTPGAVIAVGELGLAPAKLTSMKVTLDAELVEINKNPAAFLKCGDPNCIDCRFSWEGYEESLFEFVLKKVFSGKFRDAALAVTTRYFYRFPF